MKGNSICASHKDVLNLFEKRCRGVRYWVVWSKGRYQLRPSKLKLRPPHVVEHGSWVSCEGHQVDSVHHLRNPREAYPFRDSADHSNFFGEYALHYQMQFAAAIRTPD